MRNVKKDCIVFKRADSINEMLAHVLQFKGEAERGHNKIGKYNLYVLAHSGSGFYSYVVLNNVPQWRTVVNIIKNGAGFVSLKICNGYVEKNKKNSSIRSFSMWKSSYQQFDGKDRY